MSKLPSTDLSMHVLLFRAVMVDVVFAGMYGILSDIVGTLLLHAHCMCIHTCTLEISYIIRLAQAIEMSYHIIISYMPKFVRLYNIRAKTMAFLERHQIIRILLLGSRNIVISAIRTLHER